MRCLNRNAQRPSARTEGIGGPIPGLVCAAAILLPAGCQSRTNLIRIEDIGPGGSPRSLYQEFDQAYYLLDAAGSLQLILRRHEPSRAIPTENITQTILVETYWRPVPGATHVESTMINAKITYLIRSGRTTRCYEGHGFVSFTEARNRESLRGKIESGVLKPTAESGHPPHPFGKAHLQGSFRALRQPRRATAILTDLARTIQNLRPVSE